jgi:hypothetical protein
LSKDTGVELNFDQGIARVPKLIAVLGLAGTGVAGWMGGLAYALAFLVGAGAAYFNFRLIERAVDRLGRLAGAAAKAPRASGAIMFIQFAVFAIGAFVILRLSGFNVAVALCGFLVCPAAVLIEIFYELLTYEHS